MSDFGDKHLIQVADIVIERGRVTKNRYGPCGDKAIVGNMIPDGSYVRVENVTRLSGEHVTMVRRSVEGNMHVPKETIITVDVTQHDKVPLIREGLRQKIALVQTTPENNTYADGYRSGLLDALMQLDKAAGVTKGVTVGPTVSFSPAKRMRHLSAAEIRHIEDLQAAEEKRRVDQWVDKTYGPKYAHFKRWANNMARVTVGGALVLVIFLGVREVFQWIV